jgi:tol-pal system protein YbgF
VFDPAQNPTAPGAPRVLGSPASASVPLPQASESAEAAPGGAPLDLSTMAEAAAHDPSLVPPGRMESGGQGSSAPARGTSGAGERVATLPPSDSPKDNYDLAYGYVMRKDYALAEDGFRSFLTRFPHDRLAPDAYYWLGESLFQSQQFRDAAESFLTVSTKYETTGRAPEALLRLGQSLAALGEKEAACASLAEVMRKYPRASVGVKQGVEREQKRARC